MTNVRMHLAHKTLRAGLPSTIIVTFCKFGVKERLVAFKAWLRVFPNCVVFPQCSHFAIADPFNLLCVNSTGQYSQTSSLPYNETKFNMYCSNIGVALI